MTLEALFSKQSSVEPFAKLRYRGSSVRLWPWTYPAWQHSQELTRIVGLSATLPNYDDVAEMLRVDAKNGLFVFDNTFRPCPLQQVYIGVTAKRPFKQYQVWTATDSS